MVVGIRPVRSEKAKDGPYKAGLNNWETGVTLIRIENTCREASVEGEAVSNVLDLDMWSLRYLCDNSCST